MFKSRSADFIATEPGVMTEEEADAGRSEQRRALYEFLRHLMTLDAGALVLVATIIEKVFPAPAHRAAIGLAVVAFLSSIVAAGISYLILLGNYPRVGAERMASQDRRVLFVSLTVTFTCFLMGMAMIAWFFLVNWWR